VEVKGSDSVKGGQKQSTNDMNDSESPSTEEISVFDVVDEEVESSEEDGGGGQIGVMDSWYRQSQPTESETVSAETEKGQAPLPSLDASLDLNGVSTVERSAISLEELGPPESKLKQKVRALVLMASAAVLLLVGGVTVLYQYAPTQFDQFVGQYIGVRAQLHPDSVDAYRAGLEKIRGDTLPDLKSGLRKFEEAINLEPRHVDAQAMEAVTHALRALTYRDLLEIQHKLGKRAAEFLNKLNGFPTTERPENFLELRQTVQQDLIRFGEQGTKELRADLSREREYGRRYLRKLEGQLNPSPKQLAAAMLFSLLEEDGAKKIEGFRGKLDQEAILSLWGNFANSYVMVETSESRLEAVKSLMALLEDTQVGVRSKAIYAKLLAGDANEREVARTHVAGLLATQGEHPIGLALQMLLAAPPDLTFTSKSSKSAVKGSVKKRGKGKRSRGKSNNKRRGGKRRGRR